MLLRLSQLFSPCILFLTSSISSHAFAPSVTRSRTTTRLYGMTRRFHDGDDNQKDDSSAGGFDIEAARQQLEALVANDPDKEKGATRRGSVLSDIWQAGPSFSDAVSQDMPTSLDTVLPPSPPLTTIERQRRQAELNLLAQLEDSDDVMSDLWDLWSQERGPEAAARLVEVEKLTEQGPAGWEKAEHSLREMIETHGVYWAEAVNRLATLCYMQSRYKESEALCKVVLAVKPWHFGALSGIVMVYAAQHDVEAARHWAARRLPSIAPTGANRRRFAWVQKAVADAQDSLFCAESRLKEIFGEQDSHDDNNSFKSVDGLDDAWQ